MKIYIRSNMSNTEPIETIEVIMNLSIPASSIAASHDDDSTRYIVNPVTDITDLGMFKRLINEIETEASKLGLYRTHIEKSSTNSTYMDFCLDGLMGSRTVRVMCFLRITDHHDWDKATRMKHIEKRLTFYQTGKNEPNDNTKYDPKAAQIGQNNGRGGVIKPYLENIMVGSDDCNTIDVAVKAVKEKLIKFILVEKRPFDDYTVKAYTNQLEDKISKLQLSNMWDVTYKESDVDFFTIIFNETTPSGDRLPKVFLSLKYTVPIEMLNNDLGSVTVDMKAFGKGQKRILDIDCTQAHKDDGMFEDPKVQKLFKDYIAKAIQEVDALTIQ